MKKNLLYVCDLRRVIWDIGNFLQVQMDSMISRWEHKADRIDIIWLYRFENPASAHSTLNENHYYFLSKLLPLAYVNPYLGLFMLLRSVESLELYVNAGKDVYEGVVYTLPYTGRPHFGGVYGETISFYEKYGFIPYLSCQPAMLLWANTFLKLHEIIYPIVVHLRRDPCGRRPQSDSDFDAWLGFFKHCRSKYKKRFMFVVIGTREEIDPRFREIGNVIFSKDYGTTVEQDLALIQASLMFMGCSSGPESMAVYGGMPYLIFDPFLSGRDKKGYECIERGTQYPFAMPLQRLVWKPGTMNIIVEEFEKLISEIDIRQWKQRYDEIDITRLKRSSGSKGKQRRAYIL